MSTILYTIAVILFITFFFPVLFIIWAFTVPFDKNRSIMHETSRVLSHMIIRICPFWKVEVKGKENISRDQTYIIVANHQSMYDIPLTSHIPLNFKWVSKKEVYKIPIFGWVLWLRGDIGIERGGLSSTKKMLKIARRYIQNKISLVVYAEGTRSKTGRINRFKEGAFIIAKMTGTPILPVVIDGTWIVMNHKGFGLKMPNKFRITILDPIPVEEVKRLDVTELSALCKGRIESVYKEVSGVGYENENV